MKRITFGRLWEIIDKEEPTLQTSGEEGQAMEAIRSGLYLRKEGCGSFWDDFISVCGNADAISELLDVPKEKITGWGGKIRELVEKVEQMDAGDSKKGKAKLVTTGKEQPPDVFGNDANADLRPMPS
jgi:hypothetical protein